MAIEDSRSQYEKVLGKKVPPNKNQDLTWIDAKIEEVNSEIKEGDKLEREVATQREEEEKEEQPSAAAIDAAEKRILEKMESQAAVQKKGDECVVMRLFKDEDGNEQKEVARVYTRSEHGEAAAANAAEYAKKIGGEVL